MKIFRQYPDVFKCYDVTFLGLIFTLLSLSAGTFTTENPLLPDLKLLLDRTHPDPSKVSMSPRRVLPVWPPTTLSLPASTTMAWLCLAVVREGRDTHWPEVTS